MLRMLRPWLGLALAAAALPAAAQEKLPAPAAPSAPVTVGVAATVNGQPIAELAVQRALKSVPAEHQAEARAEVLEFFVNNVLIDQYLQQLSIAVEKKEVDEKVEQVHADIKRGGQPVERVLKELQLTEEELREQISAVLRWEKFATQQATEQALRALFDGNKDLFDGSLVRARHILLVPSGEGQSPEKCKAELLLCKDAVEKKVAEELAKLSAGTDALAREQARTKLMDEEFGRLAQQKSACPSKAQGGDVGWFARAGGMSMVEPFARAAFALKPYQMSDVVQTKFGLHLILATDRKPGKEPKFEDVQAEVKEAYYERLREALCARLRPTAKVVIHPAPKP